MILCQDVPQKTKMWLCLTANWFKTNTIGWAGHCIGWSAKEISFAHIQLNTIKHCAFLMSFYNLQKFCFYVLNTVQNTNYFDCSNDSDDFLT